VQDALRDRQRSYLEAALQGDETFAQHVDSPCLPVPPITDAEVAARYVEAPYLISLAENFGMRPEVVREWAMANGSGLDWPEQAFLRLIADTAAAYGLKGEQAEHFFSAALHSPERAGMDENTNFEGTVFQFDPTSEVAHGDPEAAKAHIAEARAAQAEWFRVNMPEIYEQFFAPIPGAPPYAQPGYGDVYLTGYCQDLIILMGGTDANVSGTEPPP
jgi:hypothetical protein